MPIAPDFSEPSGYRSRKVSPIGELVRDFLKRKGLSSKLVRQELDAVWKQLITVPEKRQLTRVAGLSTGGRLQVEVSDPTFLSELKTMHRLILLDAFNAVSRRKITDIHFYPSKKTSGSGRRSRVPRED